MPHDEHWLQRWHAYTDFIETNKRCPSKYKPEERDLVNWAKSNRKLRNKGLLSAVRLEKFNQLTALSQKYRRVNQHAYLHTQFAE